MASKARPGDIEIKREPLAVKMEGTADNLSQPKLLQPKEEATPRTKENAAPYRTPGAKVAARQSGISMFTPPSTGYCRPCPDHACLH